MRKSNLLGFFLIGFLLNGFSQADDGYLKSGLEKFEARDYPAAIGSFNKAIALNPASAEDYCARANAKMALRDTRNAITDYNKAIELNAW